MLLSQNFPTEENLIHFIKSFYLSYLITSLELYAKLNSVRGLTVFITKLFIV